jgi:hypothetical protein
MSEKNSGRYFAWQRSPKGPTPVKYYDGVTKSDEPMLIVKFPISAEEILLSFGELSRLYPAPPPQED